MSEGAAHSIAAPSALHQIRQCPGSIVMQQPFPEVSSADAAQDAAEGTAAHWVMAEWMGGRIPRVDDRAPNGVYVTDEMIEAVELMVDDVRRTVEPFGMTLADCITEVPVDIKRIHDLCWGTPDVRVWLPTPMPTIVVWDLKFGRRFVPAFENEQLVAYTVGCIDAAGKSDLEVIAVNRIVQPRSYHRDGPVREWRYRASDVRALVNLMNMAVAEALGPNPRTHVGPACRDCRARFACETLQRAGETAMDVAGQAMPHILDDVSLGVELRNITRMFKLLEARKEALEEQAIARSRAGARIPHFRAENGGGRQTWKKPASEVIALGQMLGIDLAKPPAAVTPLQAAARGFPEALAVGYVEKSSGGFKLVPDDGSEFRRVFARPTTPPGV